jgi:hypothetical protein
VGGGARDPGVPIINIKNFDDRPVGGNTEDPGAPTIKAKNVDGAPLGPLGHPVSIHVTPTFYKNKILPT